MESVILSTTLLDIYFFEKNVSNKNIYETTEKFKCDLRRWSPERERAMT